MKVAIFESKKSDKVFFKKELKKHNVVFVNKELNEKTAKKVKGAEIVIIFVNSKVSKEILECLPSLRYVVTRSTGFDHIDVSECKKRGVKVSNVPHYGENTVAEYTFALMLALIRNVHIATDRTHKGNFSIEGLGGFDLKGKTLGVIGPGSIGQHVMKIAKGFEMNIITCGRKKNKKISKEFSCNYVSLQDLFKKADIITIHVPLLPSTKGLVGKKEVKKMRKGSYIINTARGEIIDTTALLHGLKKGIIAGAALDVLEGEEEIKMESELIQRRKMNHEELTVLRENHELLKQHNVIITPHIAFFTEEALQRILQTTIDNVMAFNKGKVINEVKAK